MQYWRKNEMENYVKANRKNNRPIDIAENEVNEIQDFQSIFILWTAGISMSILFFIFEFCQFALKFKIFLAIL